jgi:hypothetical protein
MSAARLLSPPLPPETAALPVAKLPSATVLPRPGPVDAPRGPFEPARPSHYAEPDGEANQGTSLESASVTGSVEPPAFEPPHDLSAGATARLDQIKDLYLTAEAIGDDALDKHFNQISARQRELIKEYFERMGRH